MKNHNPIGPTVLLITITLSIFTFCYESQAEDLSPILLLLLGNESVSSKIGPAGGHLEVQDAKGNSYRLIIPQGSLAEEKVITLVPLTASEGIATQLGPLSAGLALFPNGLTFSTPVKLEIVLSQDTIIPTTPAIYLEEEVGKPGILLEAVQSGQTLTASLEHFSNAIPVGGIGAMGLQLFINSTMHLVSQWESNCAATNQMAEKRNFYEDSLESETLVLQSLQMWGQDGNFNFEHRTSGVDFCGDLFDHGVTYINICYGGTCWSPATGNVEMEVNDQRQFDYEIVCVNGFCQGDVIWSIPRIPPDQPPLASVTPNGLVTALREGTGDLNAFSKEFSDIFVPDTILGNIGLDVTVGPPGSVTCTYSQPDSDWYVAKCGDSDSGVSESWAEQLVRINNIHTATRVDYSKSINGTLIGSTIWYKIVDTQFMLCYPSIPTGWYVVHNTDQNGNWESINGIPSGQFPNRYTINGAMTACWPDYQWYPYKDCGEYNCPLGALSISATLDFPGECHQWWDHYDDQGNWVQCGL